MFKKKPTETNELSEIVGKSKPINDVTKKLLKRLKGFVLNCFKIVRIVSKPDEVLEKLYAKRRILWSKQDYESMIELEKLEEELSEKYSESSLN